MDLGTALGLEIVAGGGGFGDVTGGGDVVGGDRVGDEDEALGALDGLGSGGPFGERLEVGRVLDVCALGVPLVEIGLGDGDLVPGLVAREDVGVLLLELFRRDALGFKVLDFLVSGPDVFEEDLAAIFCDAEGFGAQVEVDRAGDGVGDAEGRAREVVGLDVRVDAAFEVAVSRENRGDDEIAGLDRGFDGIGEGTRSSRCRCAAVADRVEPEGLEILGEVGLVVVLGDNLGSGGEAGLDPRLGLETEGAGLARDQSRGDHDIGVAGVGAGGDGRDHDVAVVEVE
jgi:hypothetical protein